MAEIGSVIDGKYEIVTEIGRGGMSVVYAAKDKRLGKMWAVKEIRKKGRDKQDRIVENSFLTEANLMKRLDHPSLPRIVDIIDDGVNLCVVMDLINGQRLDKVLKESGPQPEERVIIWAKQLCDGLSYLHSQNPPIIYRDMKPSNVMLRSEDDNIKIIDFGIAREYKENKELDTVPLGTDGYAPPEQGGNRQTDARSDIYALGMTMHHLLTNISPKEAAYQPVREINPSLSEGIELIIDRCVQPAPENRYQTCAELLYDLEHPDLITKGFKQKQKRKLAAFLTSLGLTVVMTIAGVSCHMVATHLNNQDYDACIAGSNPERYYEAVEIYPARVDAYDTLIDYYRNHDAEEVDIKKIGNVIEAHADDLNLGTPEIANMYYEMGKLYFSDTEGSLKSRAVSAQNFFKASAGAEAEFDKKSLAACYYSICRFMTNQSTTSEHSMRDFEALFDEIESVLKLVEPANDSEANYDKISLYYVTMLLINDQGEYMAGVGFDQQKALDMMERLYQKTNGITSTLVYVNGLKDEIEEGYSSFLTNINAKYSEVEKRQQGGK